MKVGFVVWNPFQLIQFESIASKLNFPTVFIIRKNNNMRLFSPLVFKDKKWKVEFIKPSDIQIIDGICDILLFQSAFPNIEKIRKSKLVSLQYGLAKERHNYGEWRALSDMNLMYGSYSSNVASHYSPSYSVGNPKFDDWEEYKKKYSNKHVIYNELGLDPNKKTLLYMPTWGELGSFFELLDTMASLQCKYNVILKMHHNNDAKTPAWINFANELSLKHIYDGSSDQLKLLCAADLVISDFSGAIFDGLYAKKPILLYQAGIENKLGIQKFDLNSLEFHRREDIGYVCTKISDFESSIQYCMENADELVLKASSLREDLFYLDYENSSSQLCVDYITKLHNGLIPSLSQAQLYVRETVKELRGCRLKIKGCEKKTIIKVISNRMKSLILMRR